ncbi:MAG: lipopolysaccharide biosynthesis protein [Methylococcales bacterium]|nr:lipopolysaccharide biosynthesis protein [Methylococcales bacterium]
MIKKRSLLSDGVLIGGLQGLSALGQLTGIRLLTDILSPTVFGEISLWMGAVALISTGIANPTMQALLRYYPEYAQLGQGAMVKAVARQQLCKLILWFFPILLIGVVEALNVGWGTISTMAILLGIVTVEIIRIQNCAYLNAIRSHLAFSIWAVAESWSRPLLAYWLAVHLDATINSVLIGYFLASLATCVIMRQAVPRDPMINPDLSQQILHKRFWQYTLPLLPLGILGWASGMADRYMIAALLSPADAGFYVAIYGLASRPVLIFGNIVETVIRPVYQQALAEDNQKLAHRYLGKWVLVIIIGAFMIINVTWLSHSWIAKVMLGEKYRNVSYLLPWIAGGYSLLVLSHVANRVCYANGATVSVLVIEGTGTLIAIASGLVCIYLWGLWGATIAVSIYYGVQLIVAYCFAKPWLSAGIK